jgi:hypothetical protein
MKILSLIFLMVISLVGFLISFRSLRLYNRVKNWRSTRGKLISSETYTPKMATGEGPGGLALRIKYTFDFEGEQHTGNAFHAMELEGGERSYTPGLAKKIMKKIPENPVVFFNPDNPSQSFIRPETRWFGIGTFSLSFLLLMLALFFAIFQDSPEAVYE